MLIEQGLMTYLLAQSAITAIVSDRIFFVKADQSVETPYIVITKVSGVREHSHDGSSHLAHPHFQLSIFSDTYSSCKSVATVLQTALQGYSGAMSDATAQAVFYENETDTYESDTSLFQVILDYTIWHTD